MDSSVSHNLDRHTPAPWIEKRRHIKDPVWQSILVLGWEKILIDHPVFHRLNNILQNSSGFRVYPGLKVSRFLHSLGAMHVATKIFTNVLSERGFDRTDPHSKFPYDHEDKKSIYEEAIGRFVAEGKSLAGAFDASEMALIHN